MNDVEALADIEQRLLDQIPEIRAGIGEQAALGVEHAYHIVRAYRIIAEQRVPVAAPDAP